MKFGDLRGILQYVPQFRGQTFVVALDGAVAASEALSHVLLDIAVLRSLNIRVILVFGAAHQIRELADSRGVTLSNNDGTGVTDSATLEVSLDAITRLGGSLMQGLTAVQLRAASANAVISHRAGIIRGIDRQHTGTVERVDRDAILGVLAQDLIPLVPPIGYDGKGHTLRMNSDEVAVEVAVAAGASKLIFLTLGSSGFDYRDPDTPRQLPRDEAEALLADLDANSDQEETANAATGLRSKLKHALIACDEGVARVHLVDAAIDDALLAELFSNEGVGTMVFSDGYQRIRSARPSDVDEMMLMTQRAMKDERLLGRSREDLEARLEDYTVMEIDGNVVGCVALHPWGGGKFGELACLFIKRDHEGRGYGQQLIEHVTQRAREGGMQSLFALSTQAADYFSEKRGFRIQDDLDWLPNERREQWESSGRNARLMVRDLR